MGSVSVSSCRCCMFVSCVHPLAVLNAAFCMTCSLLMLLWSVYSPFSDRIGLPVHNTPSPFLSVMDIFFVNLKFCHIRFYTHVLLGPPTGPLHSTLNSINFFTQSSSRFLITCPYHLSMPRLMTVVIGSTPTSLRNSSFVLLSFI